MAGNPLFACVRGNKFSYNPSKSKELLSATLAAQIQKPVTVLSLRSLPSNSQPSKVTLKMSDRDNPPAPKRRKTEEAGDEWDDDDFDLQLSQADFDQIENMTSKGVNPSNQGARLPGGNASTSSIRSGKAGTVGRTPSSSDPGRPRPSGSYLQPQSVSAPPSLNTSRTHTSFLKPTPLNRSTSSSSSVSNGVSSDNYPSGLSSYSSKSSSSIRSLSSEEIPYVGKMKSESLGSTQQGSESMDTFVRSPVTAGMQAEIDRYKREYNSVKSQLDKVREEMCCKEGEIKILRQKLRDKEGEINVVKEEKIRTLERHNKEQSEHEKSLNDKVEKLNTQLQFKEHDILELKGRCQQLESKLQAAGDSAFSSPFKASQRPVAVSPKAVKTEHSPKGKSSFPTQHSFMADDRLPGNRTSRTILSPKGTDGKKPTKDATTMAQLNERATESTVRMRRRRQFCTLSETPGGRVSGAQLIADLVDSGAETSEIHTDRGIVGLLQTQTSVLDLQAIQFDRDTSSNLLSPVRSRRLTEIKSSLIPTGERVETKPFGTPEHHTLALQALQQMLRDTDCVQRSAIPHSSSVTLLSDSPVPSTSRTVSCRVENLPENSAISFLPLLNDYLSQYIEMLNCAVEKTGTSPQSSASSKSSGSMDSSLESFTSSLNLLLKDCAAYANNLESLALVALKILLKLVSNCECVREVLVQGECGGTEKTGTTAMDTDSKQQGEKSDVESDQSDVFPPVVFSTRQSVAELAVLRKLFHLANPGQSGHRYNTHIVEKALDILIVLSKNLTEDHVDSMLPVIMNGVLINCLECDVDPSIMIRGMTLMTSLVKFNPFVSQLCFCSDGCLLSVLYQTSTCNLEHFSSEQILHTSQQMIQCVQNIVSVHKGGVIMLLESNCRCSIQIVKSLVLVLHRVLQIYENKRTEESLSILRQGLLLLHLLFTRDDNFTDHRYPVEHQYVRLICGLASVFKHLSNNEQEKNALSDLWDFDQDDEFSQESDDDESSQMDTS